MCVGACFTQPSPSLDNWDVLPCWSRAHNPLPFFPLLLPNSSSSPSACPSPSPSPHRLLPPSSSALSSSRQNTTSPPSSAAHTRQCQCRRDRPAGRSSGDSSRARPGRPFWGEGGGGEGVEGGGAGEEGEEGEEGGVRGEWQQAVVVANGGGACKLMEELDHVRIGHIRRHTCVPHDIYGVRLSYMGAAHTPAPTHTPTRPPCRGSGSSGRAPPPPRRPTPADPGRAAHAPWGPPACVRACEGVCEGVCVCVCYKNLQQNSMSRRRWSYSLCVCVCVCVCVHVQASV